jgi:hypothetical protein
MIVEIKLDGGRWRYRVDMHGNWYTFDKKEIREATEQETVIEYCKSIGASKVVIVS